MKIISKYNKKDFYDYLGFQYDTSDDIVYLRETRGLFTNKPEDYNIINKCYKLIENKIPNYSHNVSFNHFKYHKYSCIISHVIVGIYPYVYVVPIVELRIPDEFNKNVFKTVFIETLPYECYDNEDKILDYVNLRTGISQDNIYIFHKPNGKEFKNTRTYYMINTKFECQEIFHICNAPTFILFVGGWLKNWYNTDSIQSIISNSFDLIANHCGMILNPIFNECKRVNIIYSILDDLTVNRSVYNDIENFLWANKQEPISELDNKTKIINHGFDLKTSFRKM
jgi:hypothetical protein